jgi:hypothetical protein
MQAGICEDCLQARCCLLRCFPSCCFFFLFFSSSSLFFLFVSRSRCSAPLRSAKVKAKATGHVSRGRVRFGAEANGNTLFHHFNISSHNAIMSAAAAASSTTSNQPSFLHTPVLFTGRLHESRAAQRLVELTSAQATFRANGAVRSSNLLLSLDAAHRDGAAWTIATGDQHNRTFLASSLDQDIASYRALLLRHKQEKQADEQEWKAVSAPSQCKMDAFRAEIALLEADTQISYERQTHFIRGVRCDLDREWNQWRQLGYRRDSEGDSSSGED